MLNKKILLNFNIMQLLLSAIMVLGYVFNIKACINFPLIIIIILKIFSLKGKVLILLRNVLTYIDYKLLVLMFTFASTLFISSIVSYDNATSFEYSINYSKWMFVAFFAAYLSLYNIKNFEKIILISFLIAILIIDIGIFYKSYVLEMYRPGDFFIKAPNATAGLIIFLLPFILFCKTFSNNYIRMIIIFLSILALVITGSRGAIIGGVISILIGIYFRWKQINKILMSKKFFAFVLVVFLMISFILVKTKQVDRFTEMIFYKNPSVEYHIGGDRILLWKSSLEMIKDHPIFGVGIRQFNKVYIEKKYISEEAKEPELISPHNIFLHIFTEVGLIGICSFSLLILYQLKNLKKYITDDFILSYFLVIIGMCVHGMFDFLFTFKFYFQLYFFICGCTWLYIKRNLDKEVRTKYDT